MIEGSATASGTEQYASKFAELQNTGHFRHREGTRLLYSSLGIGTYLGDADDETDAAYVRAITVAIASGINVVDTARNYRHQRSERAVGHAIADAINNCVVQRENIVVCTKIGYIPYELDEPLDHVGYLRSSFIDTGIVPEDDLNDAMHCIRPRYIQQQIQDARICMGLQTIDIVYLHNIEEQKRMLADRIFWNRLRHAFEALESAVDEGLIVNFGIASWDGFRCQKNDRDYIDLDRLLAAAEDVYGGPSHHFRFLQIPFNMHCTELMAGLKQQKGSSILARAEALKLTVVTSATLAHGACLSAFPKNVQSALGANTATEAAILLSRSLPGVTTSLVGMSAVDHVEQNVRACLIPPVALELC